MRVNSALGEIEALGVDIHQGDLAAVEQGEGEDVLNQLARESEAAGADEGDFWHGVGFSEFVV